MFFSPITERSLKVRFLYGVFYFFLLLGAISIVAPLLILLTGSVEPVASQKSIRLYPAYLGNDHELWRSYLLAKYNQSLEALRQAWGDPSLTEESLQAPSSLDSNRVKLWEEFRRVHESHPLFETAGFLGTARLPQRNRRLFARQLMNSHDGDLSRLNEAMSTQFSTVGSIMPPAVGLTGSHMPETPLLNAFYDFIQGRVGYSERIPFNCAGFYRASFLPRRFGADISAFNAKYRTNYASYAEIPFSSTVPSIGAEEWFMMASKILRPNFVELTETGEERLRESGLGRNDFIRLRSQPEDLRIRTLDTVYADWARAKGAKGAEELNLPQRELDYYYFSHEKGVWKQRFLFQNYAVVIDEILLHGRAISNTIILVLLSVGGTLVVNPLAAYALSRYRPKLTYQILLFCLATVALPGEVTLIPVFLQLKEFGLLNSFGALIIPGLASGFSIFLLKGFFDSLPRELYEAAEIDGASEWLMFWKITMNLSRPILAVLALGAFVHAYGTFMYALILCPDPKMWTIMVYLFQLMQSMDTPVLYAGLIISAIPTTLVFIFCQSIIMRGIVVPVEK